MYIYKLTNFEIYSSFLYLLQSFYLLNTYSSYTFLYLLSPIL